MAQHIRSSIFIVHQTYDEINIALFRQLPLPFIAQKKEDTLLKEYPLICLRK